ncbi:MAG: dihydrofolate reductase [Rhodoferax sp.]|uniref:dihydrofolate reductase n=1 Tax=Rhodoferax sp. TaxID=50421 RepID=UPI003264C498
MPPRHQSAGGGMTQLHLIFARAANGVIGINGTLPWHLPEDMAHFKRTTLGCPVIMGRKTWDSLPARFRPLPGRINIVVTRQADWLAEGALRARSIAEAAALCPAGSDAWVIGGAEMYAQALPLAQSAVVTEIDSAFEGDAFAPNFDAAWTETSREAHTSSTGLGFSFVRYQRQR